MARLIELLSIHETQWVLTSAFNRLNLINWLAPDLSCGVVFLLPALLPDSPERFLFPHGLWERRCFQVHFFMCFIPSLIMLDSGVPLPFQAKP